MFQPQPNAIVRLFDDMVASNRDQIAFPVIEDARLENEGLPLPVIPVAWFLQITIGQGRPAEVNSVGNFQDHRPWKPLLAVTRCTGKAVKASGYGVDYTVS